MTLADGGSEADHGFMSEQIIVGFNGTNSSMEAVRWAAAEAAVRRVPMHIVTCFEMPALTGEASLAWGAGEAYDAVRTVAEMHAHRAAAVVSDEFPNVVSTTEVSADAASVALLKHVDGADLVVVGASGHEGVASFWLGTTPRHLVHHSLSPVAVIRSSASRGRPDRIVVGIDGSSASNHALLWAADEADRHDVELVVVHGWSYPYAPVDTASMQARELTQIDAACTLDTAMEAARARCGVSVRAVLVEASPVSALLETVEDGDLLVVGSRGRGAIKSRLFGSTANTILDVASVPVIVVRAPSNEPATESEAALTHVG